MSSLGETLEGLWNSSRKTFESLVQEPSLHDLPQQLRKLFSFDYDDKPLNSKFYSVHFHWLKWVHDYYFQVEHLGHWPEAARAATDEKVILISNHGNTLEVPLICYKFWNAELGVIRSLVFKEAFRLPLIREIFKSGQCLPISVEAGRKALKKDHIVLFPEGMDFIKHYLEKDYVVKFHKGFLRIAKEYLVETQQEHVTIIPVAHDGLDQALKFWVINNPFLVENFIKPYLGFPFFVLPKATFVFPAHAVFNWGTPRQIRLSDLKDEKSLTLRSNEFRNELLRLKHRARRLRAMKGPAQPEPSPSQE